MNAAVVFALFLPLPAWQSAPPPTAAPDAHDAHHTEPILENLPAESVAEVAPQAHFWPSGAAVTLAARRLPVDAATGFGGFRLAVEVFNPSPDPIRLERLHFLAEAPARGAVPAEDLRVLTYEAATGSSRVTRLGARLESDHLVAAALPGRDAAFLAGFVRAAGGSFGAAAPRLALEPRGEQFLISAWLDCAGAELAAGATLAAPDLPELLVLFAPDALPALKQFAALAGGGAATGSGAHPPFAPLLPAAGEHRAPVPNPLGEPLDLFAGDGRPGAWRIRDEEHGALLLLANQGAETELLGASFLDFGLDPARSYELVELPEERALGPRRRGVRLPVAPGATRRLAFAASDLPPLGFDIRLLPLTSPEAPIVVETADAAQPDLAERMQGALRSAGAVLVNHRGRRVLEPLPAAVDSFIAAPIAPHRAATLAPAAAATASSFAELAANVEWSLAFPRQDPRAPEVLVCTNAGPGATPLQPMLADGLPAARGFIVPVWRGLLIVTLDLAPHEVEAMARRLADRETLFELAAGAARARRSQRVFADERGLFRALELPRLRPGDFVPADPGNSQSWSAFVPRHRARVRTLLDDAGEPLQEEVAEFSSPLILALDLPLAPGEKLAVVMRRAPEPAPEGCTLALDGTPIGPPAPPPRAPGRWAEELWLLDQDQLAGRQRVALEVIPAGGTLPVARLGFFRYREPSGLHLCSFAPRALAGGARLGPAAGPDGGPLRLGGRAFPAGIGLPGGSSVHLPLSGWRGHLLFKAGIDEHSPAAAGGAELVVHVDGVLVHRSTTLEPDGAATTESLPLDGGELLELAALGPAAVHVAVVEARLVP